MSAADTAREIAANGVSENTIAGRTTKFIDPRVALDVQDRLDRQQCLRRGHLPLGFVPLIQKGTQD